jgi:hypothetical protein
MKYLFKLFFNSSMSLNGSEYLFRFLLYFFLNFVGFVHLFQESKLTYISLGIFLILTSTYFLFKSIVTRCNLVENDSILRIIAPYIVIFGVLNFGFGVSDLSKSNSFNWIKYLGIVALLGFIYNFILVFKNKLNSL